MSVEPLQTPFTCNVIPLSNNKLYLTQGAIEPLNLQPYSVFRSYWQKVDTSDTFYWRSMAGSISRQKFTYSIAGIMKLSLP